MNFTRRSLVHHAAALAATAALAAAGALSGSGFFAPSRARAARSSVPASSARAASSGRGGGSVINTASVAGIVGLRGSSAYCAAKAGVIALTRVAALEYGRYNIRVNCICPGSIDTPMVERITGGRGMSPEAIKRASVFSRVGKPEEIANMALFLASDESPFATGAPFIVDGGWVAS